MIYGIILAGGSGKRVGSDIPKQYIEINGKPLLYYTLLAFENSDADQIVIVADEEHLRFVVSDIVDKYGLRKVIRVCSGGAERFNSVCHGLHELSDVTSDQDIVLIHDGARPFIKPEEINAMIGEAKAHGAAIAAMPVKDTITVSDEEGFVAGTTIRERTWQIQTPQAFRFGLIKEAYRRAQVIVETKMGDFMDEGSAPEERVASSADREIAPVISDNKSNPGKIFTDDSMVVEAVFPEQRIKLVKTSYGNIKITTPEDLEVAKARL